MWLPPSDNYKTNVLVQSDTAGHYRAIGDQVNMAHKDQPASRLTFGSTRASGKERIQNLSDPSGRSLVTKGKESEPALTSVNFSFLLLLSEVKYHWSKSGKGDKTVNLLCFTESD